MLSDQISEQRLKSRHCYGYKGSKMILLPTTSPLAYKQNIYAQTF